MTYKLPLDFEGVGKLPISTFWNDGITAEYFGSYAATDRLNLTRHLFVNDVPLYFLSLSVTSPLPKHVRMPFLTLEECRSIVSSFESEGEVIGRVEFIPVADLNALHRTYGEDHGEIVHGYTNWFAQFGSAYEHVAIRVFEGLSKEHQEKFLPDESRHLLVGKSLASN